MESQRVRQIGQHTHTYKLNHFVAHQTIQQTTAKLQFLKEKHGNTPQMDGFQGFFQPLLLYNSAPFIRTFKGTACSLFPTFGFARLFLPQTTPIYKSLTGGDLCGNIIRKTCFCSKFLSQHTNPKH